MLNIRPTHPHNARPLEVWVEPELYPMAEAAPRGPKPSEGGYLQRDVRSLQDGWQANVYGPETGCYEVLEPALEGWSREGRYRFFFRGNQEQVWREIEPFAATELWNTAFGACGRSGGFVDASLPHLSDRSDLEMGALDGNGVGRPGSRFLSINLDQTRQHLKATFGIDEGGIQGLQTPISGGEDLIRVKFCNGKEADWVEGQLKRRLRWVSEKGELGEWLLHNIKDDISIPDCDQGNGVSFYDNAYSEDSSEGYPEGGPRLDLFGESDSEADEQLWRYPELSFLNASPDDYELLSRVYLENDFPPVETPEQKELFRGVWEAAKAPNSKTRNALDADIAYTDAYIQQMLSANNGAFIDDPLLDNALIDDPLLNNPLFNDPLNLNADHYVDAPSSPLLAAPVPIFPAAFPYDLFDTTPYSTSSSPGLASSVKSPASLPDHLLDTVPHTISSSPELATLVPMSTALVNDLIDASSHNTSSSLELPAPTPQKPSFLVDDLLKTENHIVSSSPGSLSSTSFSPAVCSFLHSTSTNQLLQLCLTEDAVVDLESFVNSEMFEDEIPSDVQGLLHAP
ncbi:hypothetical protein BJ508DRAFT_88239 [Ascobolus immersus RN42]|uniref:Uncharacterized protein n=1 Tax=Ascobolus immersus RN42 TaxID=1160509 RepID=A0A3N4HAU5_ASCIM|nr:hypothetical protein BJ508DRAFT_88239 [Ascobolus immersus RN42]